MLAAAALVVAACGRNGPPLPPPGPVAAEPAPAAVAASPTAAPPVSPAVAAVPTAPPATGAPVVTAPTAQQTAVKNGFDIFGNPVAPPGQKKSFLLDPLLQ
jgi:hypothetical protein